MTHPVKVSVTELKAKLLEMIRAVERGKSFLVTKDNRPVARLIPDTHTFQNATGFAEVTIVGDIVTPLDLHWSGDEQNVKLSAAKRASGKDAGRPQRKK